MADFSHSFITPGRSCCVVADIGDVIFGAVGNSQRATGAIHRPRLLHVDGIRRPASIGVALAAKKLRGRTSWSGMALPKTGTEISTAVRWD